MKREGGELVIPSGKENVDLNENRTNRAVSTVDLAQIYLDKTGTIVSLKRF